MCVCRYLKNCMWKAEKKKEMEERKLVQALYTDLVDMVRLNNGRRKVSAVKSLPVLNVIHNEVRTFAAHPRLQM